MTPVQRLTLIGFTEQQASVLSEMFPEVTRGHETDSDDAYRVIARPIEILAGGAVSSACASTGADEVLAELTIPAGTLGVNSMLQIEPLWSFASSANNKILKVKVGGVVVYTATRTTSVKEAPLIVLANQNSLTAQIQPYESTYLTAGTSAISTRAIDFSVAVDIEITGQRAAVESLSLEYYRVLHFVGD